MKENVNKTILNKVLDFHIECRCKSAVNEQVTGFLSSPEPTPETACELFRVLLELHGRGAEYKSFLEDLAKAELASAYERQRDHVVHSCLVYCVGIYLFMSFPLLRTALEEEMKRSEKSESDSDDDGSRTCSDGTAIGEFAFRWRLAALCHDIGYPLEMSRGTPLALRKCLGNLNKSLRSLRDKLPGIDSLELTPGGWFNQLNELPFAERTALSLMEEAVGADGFDLQRYWWRSRYCLHLPDHGIVSAVFIYRMADILYEYNRTEALSNDKTKWDLWNPRWLVTSIAHALAPIAYHNIIPTAGDQSAFERLVVSHPLVGLLRMADALQEWNRKYFHANSERKLVPARDVHFNIMDQAEAESRLNMRIESVEQSRVDKINKELAVLNLTEFPVKASAVLG